MTDRRRPTHYNTLGVHPRATIDEIRAAYRRAAREAHPDRHGESSSSQMAAVNEAWGVLGNPVRRQRYDLELSFVDRETIGSPASPVAAAQGPHVERRMPSQVLTPTGDFSRFPWKFLTTMGVLAIAVVLIGSLLDDGPRPAVTDNFLVQGDCVTIVDGSRAISEVVCSGPFDATVSTVLNIGEACPTGTKGFPDPMGRGEACLVLVSS